ncbi:retron system putative HNH endonuclease [Oceanobacter antarcticus]|jgi:uncharacterized protein (TIGR02646 family)|uniref:Retron system putative HNH endonuclease n=1 Tax=Oceanobacter antarcticus TaxID=3133425 RepID=A0ABW8NFC1_9GAMM|tara:strand:- start:4165 stop:4938 length:774 start_codon:yes stop_codon:yes gene_type:complete
MKKVLKGIEPPLLARYRHKNPTGSWDMFKNSRARRQQLKQQIIADQSGLCVYCEIDLKEQDSHGNADYRVEHYHPKSDMTAGHNWALDWQNLLGCCHGGSRPDVTDAAHRYTSPDCSCDIPKGSQNLDSVILNPHQMPAFPPIFAFDRTTGEPSVDKVNCSIAGIDPIKAQATIRELRLDAKRLNSLRQTVLNKLNADVRNLLQRNSELSVGEALDRLAATYLQKNSKHHWPPFFSAIRSYLGSSAEKHLRSMDYNG